MPNGSNVQSGRSAQASLPELAEQRSPVTPGRTHSMLQTVTAGAFSLTIVPKVDSHGEAIQSNTLLGFYDSSVATRQYDGV